MEVNIHRVRTHLSRSIEQIQAREDIVIAKAGAPVVRLVRSEVQKPGSGRAVGEAQVKKGWDESLTDQEIDALFGS